MYSRQLPPIKIGGLAAGGICPPAGGRRGPNLARTVLRNSGGPQQNACEAAEKVTSSAGWVRIREVRDDLAVIPQGGVAPSGGGVSRSSAPPPPWYDGLRAQTVEARGKTSRA